MKATIKSNYNKYPKVLLRKTESECLLGWETISTELIHAINKRQSKKTILVIDCYQGVFEDEICAALTESIKPAHIFLSSDTMLPEKEIRSLTQNDVTNDRIFGFLSKLNISQFFDDQKIKQQKNRITNIKEGIVLVFGIGASLLTEEPHLLVYADMARWQIQLRMRNNSVNNLGTTNQTDTFE